jgi:radical SAM protein with 4Fe4S-binding SPASM domain
MVRYLEQSRCFLQHFERGDFPGPDVIQLEVTPRCDLQCRFCALTSEKSQRAHERRDLTIEDLDRLAPVFEQASAVELTGFGELFCHPDPLATLRKLRSFGLSVFATTNGQRLTPEISRAIAEERLLDLLTVSIDAAEEETYAKLRGGDWSRLTANLGALLQAKQAEKSPWPRIWFSFLGMKSNIEQLPRFIEMASTFDAERVILQHLTENRHFIGESCFRDPERLGDVLKVAHDVAERTGVQLVATNVPPAKAAQGRARAKGCDFPWRQAFVQCDGTVSACAMVWQSLDMGNLRENDFKTIWNSDRYRETRSAIASTEPPDPCGECRYFSERNALPVENISNCLDMADSAQLGPGWHLPEAANDGRMVRWTRKQATAFLLNSGGRMLCIEAYTVPEVPFCAGEIVVTPLSFNEGRAVGPEARYPFSTRDLNDGLLRLSLPEMPGDLIEVRIAMNETWNPGKKNVGNRKLGIQVASIELSAE